MPTVPSPRFAENEPMHTPFTNLTFCIRTFGCQMNKHDSERIAGMLEGMGALQVDAIEDADIVAFMTCCVREAADTRLYGQVASLKNVPLRAGTPLSKRIVAVGGCIGQRDGEKLVDELKHLDVVFGTHNLGSLPRLLEAALEEGGHQVEVLDAASSFPTELPTAREHEWAAWLPITIGCNNFCSYCIVPYVRGREKSRPLEDIVAEAERYVAAGVKEITLLGQNVNSYGRDLYGSPRFAQVLDALDQTGIERLRFATSHPKDLNDEVVGRFATLRSLMPALHLPVQSGSDAVLAAMNRRYTRDHYRAPVSYTHLPRARQTRHRRRAREPRHRRGRRRGAGRCRRRRGGGRPCARAARPQAAAREEPPRRRLPPPRPERLQRLGVIHRRPPLVRGEPRRRMSASAPSAAPAAAARPCISDYFLSGLLQFGHNLYHMV